MTVDFIRQKLLAARISYSFETVMSHSGKVELLERAHREGYRTYLYYVATDDPEINISRVCYRVSQGGHDVPEEKIRSRYERSLELLNDTMTIVEVSVGEGRKTGGTISWPRSRF